MYYLRILTLPTFKVDYPMDIKGQADTSMLFVYTCISYYEKTINPFQLNECETTEILYLLHSLSSFVFLLLLEKERDIKFYDKLSIQTFLILKKNMKHYFSKLGVIFFACCQPDLVSLFSW